MDKEKQLNHDYDTDEVTYEFASMQDKEQSVKNMFIPVKPKEPKEDD